MGMEGLHLLADVAIADYQLHMCTDRNQDSIKKKKQETKFPDVLLSELLPKQRNCFPLDQEAYKFSDLNLLADVTAASSSLLDDWDYGSTYNTEKNNKQKKPRPKSSVKATSWSLQVNSSNLKLCLKKNNNALVPSTQTSSDPFFSYHPIDLLAQVAFAYSTSTLCANTITTKKSSTNSRRPNKKFNYVPTTPIAGTKRGFVEKEAEECQNRNSNEKRRVPKSLPIKLSNYLATKNAVSDPKLVIIKQMYDTDLSPLQCRFSIPVNQVIDMDFLTPEDRRRLDNREAIDVTLIQPCLEEKPMHLKKWMMNKTGIYVLNKGWNSVIRNKKNRLHLNSTVELWSFTCNGALYFALSTRDDDIHTAMCAGNERNDNSGDFIRDMEPTSGDESTITIHEDA